MNIDFPFHFDSRGHTASTDENDHVRDMIEQLIFTSPGERVNRPDFGSGLLQLIFAPNSPELAAMVARFDHEVGSAPDGLRDRSGHLDLPVATLAAGHGRGDPDDRLLGTVLGRHRRIMA